MAQASVAALPRRPLPLRALARPFAKVLRPWGALCGQLGGRAIGKSGSVFCASLCPRPGRGLSTQRRARPAFGLHAVVAGRGRPHCRWPGVRWEAASSVWLRLFLRGHFQARSAATNGAPPSSRLAALIRAWLGVQARAAEIGFDSLLAAEAPEHIFWHGPRKRRLNFAFRLHRASFPQAGLQCLSGGGRR